MQQWSEEETTKLLDLYVEDGYTIDEIAEILQRHRRSIISKLVRLHVYKKPEKSPKRSVKMMLLELEELLNITLDGSSLSRKQNLEIIVDTIKKLKET